MRKQIKKILLSFVILSISFFGLLNQTFADTTTATYVGTANDMGGSYPWNNPNNVIGDTTTTSSTLTIGTRYAYSNFLNLTNFDLSTAGLPTNATINGIQIEIETLASGNGMKDNQVQLTKDGTNTIGSNYGNNTNRSRSKEITTYGSLTDLWGTTWTSSDLLSTNFGIILQYNNTNRSSRTLDLYRVIITVDYTPVGVPPITNTGTIDFETAGGYTVTEGTWARTTTNPYEGLYSLESDNGGIDNTSSCFEIDRETTVNSTISFYKEVSSEANYDFLHFYINGVEQDTWSGTDSWSQEQYDILTGSYTFRWCYIKDVSVSNGSDKAWVDYIDIIPQPIPASPGGVGGLALWLKADKGTSTITSGNNLTTWNDQSGNGYNATAGVAPTYLNDATNNLNFNPIVDFNGSNEYMENLGNGASSNSYFAVIVPDNTVDGTLAGQVPFGLDCDSGVLNTGTCGLTFAGLTLGAFTIAINDEVITHAIGASTGWRSAQIGTASYQSGKPMLINMNENITADGTEISEKGITLDNYNANTYQILSSADYRIGMSSDPVNPFPYDGKIAEIINFDSRVSTNDKQKIESYLSIKYGITLNSGNTNYIASDGTTTIWSSSSAGIYKNDIFSIARDDNSGLGQIKSKSVNNDSIITIEAISEGTNLNPSFSDISDLESLSISNNDLGNTWTETDSSAGYYNLSRYWKVQEIGEVGTVNLDFDVGNINYDIPDLSIGTDYYFIYDTNNNGLLSDETPITMTNTIGDIWQISGINLNNNQIFTIGTQASTNNIPTNISLSNNSIFENVSAGTNVGTLTTTDADTLDTHTYSFVSGAGDTDNSSFTILGDTLSINLSPDFELKSQYNIRIETDDGNFGTFQKEFIININNVGETINSIIDFEDISDESKYTVTSGIWTRTTTNPQEGTYSIESDNLGAANTQSCFEVTNTFSTIGTVEFEYSVSSQANGDYLRFYIDNIEQDARSGTVPWSQYSKLDIAAGTHSYKWCYIKNGSINSGTDNAYVDYITFNNTTGETNPPIISSTNYLSGTLLPGGNHNIIINYSDSESGIDSLSDNIALYKWNGSIWGADISTTGFDLGSKTITSSSAIYTTNNLAFGKYLYNFQISDNDTNSSSTGSIFYIDEPELIINSGSLNIGDLQNGVTKFSDLEFNITVKTLGAGFDLLLNKDTPLEYQGVEITDWNGTDGFGYDTKPYTSSINLINTNEIIATQAGSINTNGNKNTYIYGVKFGTNILEGQAAGDYTSDIRFWLDLDY